MPYNFADEIRKSSDEELIRLLHDRQPGSQAAETIKAEMSRRSTAAQAVQAKYTRKIALWTMGGALGTVASALVALAAYVWGRR